MDMVIEVFMIVLQYQRAIFSMKKRLCEGQSHAQVRDRLVHMGRKSRELLLRFYHDPEFSFDEVTVYYVDRGAPNDTSCVSGRQIKTLGPGFMEIESEVRTNSIPYHRLIRILYKGIPVWERQKGTTGQNRV